MGDGEFGFGEGGVESESDDDCGLVAEGDSFGEDAAEFPTVDDQVVGPFQLDLGGGEGVDERETGGERHGAEAGDGFVGWADEDGEGHLGAGWGAEAASHAAAAGSLVIGEEGGPGRGAVMSCGNEFGVGGADFGEVFDALVGSVGDELGAKVVDIEGVAVIHGDYGTLPPSHWRGECTWGRGMFRGAIYPSFCLSTPVCAG